MKYYVINNEGVRRKVSSQKGMLQTRHDFYTWYGHEFQWGYGPVHVPEQKRYTANDIKAAPSVNGNWTVVCIACIIFIMVGAPYNAVYLLTGIYAALMIVILYGIDQRKAGEFNETKIIIP